MLEALAVLLAVTVKRCKMEREELTENQTEYNIFQVCQKSFIDLQNFFLKVKFLQISPEFHNYNEISCVALLRFHNLW